MSDFWFLFRMKLGRWMLHTSMDVMPRCDLRDDMRFAIVTAYQHHRDIKARALEDTP